MLPFMSVIDLFNLEYKINKKVYILGKTELHCIDRGNEKNNFSIPLNQLDPHYTYGGFQSPMFFIYFTYLAAGILVRSLQWFYNSPKFNFTGNVQLILFLIFLFITGYHFYHQIKNRGFRFYHIHEGTIAMTLPLPLKKQYKEKTIEFLDELVHKINQITPSNKQIVSLLDEYGLITQAEQLQLETYIVHNQSETKPSFENVIFLSH
ncbi:Uncharacterised protein [Legionella wadsworthii]|uniref:Transmembrane protein n=2 Tax=Legionella wadsworthii TaxID=28088 RepID=A0A378LTE7_9GAMM|nr:Uncharacterised protein [Legionella wadsworthii]